ncbi:MAG: hypothetical protein RIF32_03505 [Leptospirales bacterium]|jgi:hypothetical protein
MLNKWKLAPMLAAFLILAAASAVGCAGSQKAYHGGIMRGTVLEASEKDKVYLCIGSRDGAQVGQELNVYRFKQTPAAKTRWKRERSGRVKITEIVDEHFARAVVVNGSIKTNEVAELE